MTDSAPARRRGPSTALGLVLSLLASLAVVAIVVAIVVRPQPERGGISVDYVAVAEAAQQDVDEPLLAPELPEGWTANRAELVTGAADEVVRWEIGFITPERQYIGFVQGIEANATWVAARVAGATAVGDTRIAGVDWRVFDRRDAADPGNLAFALVSELGASTIVLGGTASDAEFETLATELVEEAGR